MIAKTIIYRYIFLKGLARARPSSSPFLLLHHTPQNEYTPLLIIPLLQITLFEGLVDAETAGAQPDSAPQIYGMPKPRFSPADVAEHHVSHGNPIEPSRLESLKFSNRP